MREPKPPRAGDAESRDAEAMTGAAGAPSGVRLVVADVDGTLVTPEKALTPRTRAAVRTIMEAGIAFTITSGRPPLGMKVLIDALRLEHPIAAFNGGLVVRPDLSVIRQHLLPREAARGVVELLANDMDVWVYGAQAWYIRSLEGPHVAREEGTVQFPPTLVPDYDGLLDGVVKIVGVSDDPDVMARSAAEVQRQLGQQVSATRSQPYYLDVTHPKANKGEVVSALSTLLDVPAARILTIGDGPNDILMFQRSGVSIAMGNASLEVQRAATFVTATNAEDGFAQALERFVLGTA